jgi:microcompartment protein CcmK/EutM
MFLGRVIGRVWASVKNPSLESQRLLIVQPLGGDLLPAGRTLICTDCTGAGSGELPFLPAEVPTDATIVGIVDSVNMGKKAEE